MPVTRTTRRLLLALGALLIAMLVAAGAASGAEEPWGTLGNLRLRPGTENGHVELGEERSAVAVDSTDGSFYVADVLTTKGGSGRELRLQHFGPKGETSTPVHFKVPGSEESGELQPSPELAVDSARDRVYMLVRYWRRGASKAEENEETKEKEKHHKEHEAEIKKDQEQISKLKGEQAAHHKPVAEKREAAEVAENHGEKAEAEKLLLEADELEHQAEFEAQERHFTEEIEKLKNTIFGLESAFRREPIDSEEFAAGALYAFEFKGGKLVAASKEAPMMSFEAMNANSETATEPLLNPLGLAVDPASGAVAVLGVQDQQTNVKAVNEFKAEKECRVAAQWIAVSGAAENLTGKLARRYVDTANVIGKAHHAPGGPAGTGLCGGYDEEEPAEWQAYSPAVTAGGRLLAMTTDFDEEEGEVWELPGAFAETHDKQTITPAMVYTYPIEKKLAIETGVDEPYEAMMSPAMSTLETPGHPGEGSIFLGAHYEEEAPPAVEGQINGVLQLHYQEPGAGQIEVGETGYLAGFHAFENAEKHIKHEETEAEFKREQCGLPNPAAGSPSGLGAGAIPVGAFLEGGKESVLAMSSGARDELIGVRLSAAAGAKPTECLQTSVSAPTVIVGGTKNPASVALGTEALLEAQIYAGPAEVVEWKFKVKSGATTEEEAAVVETAAELAKEVLTHKGEAGTISRIKHVFKNAGEYEITVKAIADGSNLASPAAEPTAVRKQTVTSSLKASIAELKSIFAGEAAKEIEARIEDPTIGDHVKYVWHYGDGSSSSPAEVEIKAATTPVKSEPHVYNAPCECKVEFEITSPANVKATRTLKVAEHEHKEEEHKEPPKTVTTQQTPPPTNPQPPPPGGEVKAFKEGSPEAKAAGGSLSVTPQGALVLEVACGSSAKSCSGKVTLRTASAVAAAKGKKKSVLTLASGSFTVTGGARKKVSLHLSSKARALLGRMHVLRAKAIFVARNAEGASHTSQSVVTLRLAHKKKH